MTATVNQNGPGRNGQWRAGGSPDRARQGRSAYLVGVLARAIAAQVDELARASAPAPDGWWFTGPDGAAATDGTTEREEQR